MRKCSLTAAVACVAIVGFAPAVSAQNCHTTVAQSYKESYMQNNIWPSQYVSAPRRAICNTFAMMTNNAWRQQNTLGKYHFNNDGTELSLAGETKVRWIATQAPMNRRHVFVQQGLSADATASRISSVQQYVANGYPMQGNPVEVNETYRQLESHPAAGVDNVFVGFSTSQPAPVLPDASGGGESGGE